MLTAIKNQIASALEHIEAGLHARAAEILKDLHADILAAETRVKGAEKDALSAVEGAPAAPAATASIAAGAETGTADQKAT